MGASWWILGATLATASTPEQHSAVSQLDPVCPVELQPGEACLAPIDMASTDADASEPLYEFNAVLHSRLLNAAKYSEQRNKKHLMALDLMDALPGEAVWLFRVSLALKATWDEKANEKFVVARNHVGAPTCNHAGADVKTLCVVPSELVQLARDKRAKDPESKQLPSSSGATKLGRFQALFTDKDLVVGLHPHQVHALLDDVPQVLMRAAAAASVGLHQTNCHRLPEEVHASLSEAISVSSEAGGLRTAYGATICTPALFDAPAEDAAEECGGGSGSDERTDEDESSDDDSSDDDSSDDDSSDDDSSGSEWDPADEDASGPLTQPVRQRPERERLTNPRTCSSITHLPTRSIRIGTGYTREDERWAWLYEACTES